MPVRVRLGRAAASLMVTGSKLRVRLQHAVQRAQERAPALLEMLPGVFAVEDHGDGRFFPTGRCRKSPACLDQPIHEIRRRCFGQPARIHEADQIGQRMVAEEARDLLRSNLHVVRPVQQFGLFEPPVRIALELAPDRTSEDGLVGRHPAKTRLRRQHRGLIRYRSFGWPHPRRVVSEKPAVTLPRARELLGRVFRMAEGRLRDGRRGWVFRYTSVSHSSGRIGW